jgi:hypothetical protein
MLEMLNVLFFGSCSWSGPLIFLIALCLQQNNLLQEKSEGNFSPLYLLLDNYFIDLPTLKEINIHAILDESNKLGIQQSKSENQIIALAQNDQKNIEVILRHHQKSLKKIDSKVQTILQIFELIETADDCDIETIIKKCADSTRTVKEDCSAAPSLLPFYWHLFLLSVIDTPSIRIQENFKKELLNTCLIPYFLEMAGKYKMENIYFNELLAESRFQLYLINSNFKECRNEINKLIEYKKLLHGEDPSALIKPKYLEIKVIFKEKNYKLVIEKFRNMPETWLDPKIGFDLGARVDLITIGADSYLEIGNLELSIAWREAALSFMFSQERRAGKTYALNHALALRNLYQKEKYWTQLRNLEKSCAKFGMKPIPKQPGED